MAYMVKQLNIDTWPLEYVTEWLKGVTLSTYIKSFENKNLIGKRLALIDQADLQEILSEANLNHRLTIYKAIQVLLQIKHDLNKDTLHMLIFNTQNKIVTLSNYLKRFEDCSCIYNECEKCLKYKRNEIFSATTSLAIAYRKLISWLVRIPFTRIKLFENFREDINNEMKIFLKLFRKSRASENFYKEVREKLNRLHTCTMKMLDYCDQNCEKENGKVSVAFNCSYLEKVVIRQKSPDQILGLKLTSLSQGIFTIAEIVRESAADECSHLNVEDDIIAVNNQIVIGWASDNIIRLLESSYSSGSVWLVLRKMPRDHLTSIKQQKNLVFIYKNQGIKEKRQSTHQRKHSFSDIFDFSEEFIMEDSSDEDEEDYEDFDPNKENDTEAENFYVLNDTTKTRKFSIGAFYDKTIDKKSVNDKSKIEKPVKNSKNKNRLIRSMQNLLSFDRSRSNSAENSGSTNDEPETKTKRKKSIEESVRPDLFKSLFTNKKWDFASNNSNKNSFESLDSPSTPNLIGVKKIDSIKRANSKTSNTSNSSINETDVNNKPIKSDENSIKPVSRKPPIDKNKDTYKMKTQKPTMQGWLYKKKTSPSANTTNSTSETNIADPGTSSLIRNHLNRSSKWKKYWCVLTKDYVTFYKNPDDKIPKDFLLLKDFEITKEINSKKLSFMVTDKTKQATYRFYTECVDEFNEWLQVLTELRNKIIGELILSSSNISIASDINTNAQLNDANSASLSRSLPNSSTVSRKNNNLQLQLSTIIDDDSLNNSFQRSSKNYQSKSPTIDSLTLISNTQYNSSRESSPDSINKITSRDSSPGLNYPYFQDQETESDADIYSLTLCPEKESLHKEIMDKNSNKNLKNLSSSSLTSTALTASVGISSNLDESIKNQLGYSSSNTNMDYQDRKNPLNIKHLIQPQHNRCNSLPGSLQACVGSFLNSKLKSQVQKSEQTTNESNFPVTHRDSKHIDIPVQVEYNTKFTNEFNEDTSTAKSNNLNKNQSLQNLLLQFQKNSLLPKLIKRNYNDKSISNSPVLKQNSDNSDSSPNSPTVSLNLSHINQMHPQYNYSLQQSQASTPLTPPVSTKPKTTQIKVQFGRVGNSRKINAFNFPTPDFTPHDHMSLNNNNNNSSKGLATQSPSLTPSTVYRTELTILPTSFNKNDTEN